MTEKEMINFIKNAIPELKINHIQFNQTGWDNDIIVINEDIVFRFPKNNDIARKVQSEAKLMTELNRVKSAVAVPNYKTLYDDRNQLKCVYYKYIHGTSLKEYGPRNLQNKTKNAKVIGEFLSELHCVKNKVGNFQSVQIYDYWNDLYTSVKEDIFPFLNKIQQQEIHQTFSGFIDLYPKQLFQKSIIHGDLGASNIIYDNQKGLINGIIDFTDAQLGDPAFDFAGFYWDIGPTFTRNVLSYYNGSESVESLYDRVKNFYGLQPVFHELLHAVHNEEAVNWDTALSKFSQLKNVK
ncbi:aminoglycoside phosphotransferase family protein [Virgibacillus sp. FSP13]